MIPVRYIWSSGEEIGSATIPLDQLESEPITLSLCIQRDAEDHRASAAHTEGRGAVDAELDGRAAAVTHRDDLGAAVGDSEGRAAADAARGETGTLVRTAVEPVTLSSRRAPTLATRPLQLCFCESGHVILPVFLE